MKGETKNINTVLYEEYFKGHNPIYLSNLVVKGGNDVSWPCINSQVPETKIAEFANSVDLDEMGHDEPPHLDLHCFPSSL